MPREVGGARHTARVNVHVMPEPSLRVFHARAALWQWGTGEIWGDGSAAHNQYCPPPARPTSGLLTSSRKRLFKMAQTVKCGGVQSRHEVAHVHQKVAGGLGQGQGVCGRARVRCVVPWASRSSGVGGGR